MLAILFNLKLFTNLTMFVYEMSLFEFSVGLKSNFNDTPLLPRTSELWKRESFSHVVTLFALNDFIRIPRHTILYSENAVLKTTFSIGCDGREGGWWGGGAYTMPLILYSSEFRTTQYAFFFGGDDQVSAKYSSLPNYFWSLKVTECVIHNPSSN